MDKRRLLSSALLATFTLATICTPVASAEATSNVSSTGNVNITKHTVVAGDTPWLLSKHYQVSLEELLVLNGFDHQVVIYIGDQLKIPQTNPQRTDEKTAPAPAVNALASRGSGNESQPSISYTEHTITRGESLWAIGNQYGVPITELLEANNLTSREVLYVGQKLQVPVRQIPQRATVSAEHGELLDWFAEAQYLWPIGAIATVTDYYTKKSWQVVRSYGISHADVEPLTSQDAATMKSVWGGSWSWTPRPVIVEVDGRSIAASANGMPHSIQNITNNNFSGHSCIHFLNSRQHNTNAINPTHQRAVNIAAGTVK